MEYLIASLLILASTPLIVAVVLRYQRASRWGAAILLCAIVYNIFVHIIAENIQTFGWMAVWAAGIGAVLFGVGDEVFFGHSRPHSRWFLVLLQGFLAVHAMVDGAALIGSELPITDAQWLGHNHGEGLSLSIILHRLLFEVFIWKYFFDLYGKRMATLVLLNVGASTIIGFFGSKALFSLMPSYFGLFEAFIGGALLHLVYDYFKERIKSAAPKLAASPCQKSQESHVP